MKIVLFDTETTGLVKPEPTRLSLQPHIIELYAVKLDEKFQLIEDFETFFKPPIPISEEITRITKITEKDVEYAPVFLDKYADLAKFMTGVDVIVAHNLEFDANMLSFELRRIAKEFQFPWPRHRICTVEKSFHLQGYRLNMAKLHQLATGKSFKDAHRAKVDVIALVRCFHWLCEEEHINLKDYD